MATTQKDVKIGFLGAGKMAQAMVKGFLSSGLVKPENVSASAPRTAPNLCVFKELGAHCTQDNGEVVKRSQVVFLAMKPHILPGALKELASLITKDHLVISVAAGVTLKSIEDILSSDSRVIRVAPNTPCHVKLGACAYSVGVNATEEDCTLVDKLLCSIGICERLPDRLIDPILSLSGSGTAFIYMAIEALSDGGVKVGLPRDVAIKMAAQTMMGAGKMVLETGKHPGELKDAVTSPGGSTIAGIHDLERAGYRGALMSAVETATKRARELGS